MILRGIRDVLCTGAILTALSGVAIADVVTDANVDAAEVASTIPQTPYAVRAMALVQVSVYDAVQSITGAHQPIIVKTRVTPDASVEAAVAAATRAALLGAVPAEKERIEARYQELIAGIPAGPAKDHGIAAGEQAAAAVLAARTNDGANVSNAYLPVTTPGRYVPTALPVAPHWGRRTPWLMTRGSQYRPGPPPALDSPVWKRDLAEVAAVGAKNGARRSDAQSTIARYWDTTSPSVYWPVVRSVAVTEPGVSESSRLLAEAAIAMDDALIAVFDAKYAYQLWRPITAIRNGSAGIRDSVWQPMLETPMHPEYPCAHCIVSATVGAVLDAELGDRPCPTLRSTSPTGGGVERTWTSTAEFVHEVSEARICGGVHYRNSTEVAQAMGRRIGRLAQQRWGGVGESGSVTNQAKR